MLLIADAKPGMIHHVTVAHLHAAGVIDRGFDNNLVSRLLQLAPGDAFSLRPVTVLILAGDDKRQPEPGAGRTKGQHLLSREQVKPEGRAAVKGAEAQGIGFQNALPQEGAEQRHIRPRKEPVARKARGGVVRQAAQQGVGLPAI